ncbi:MAG: agmatinase family protein [Dehalococcoidia bacterium]
MYRRGPMPYYGGLVSFFRTPEIELEQITEGMAVVAGVPIDNAIVAVRQGTRFGPRAIREWSMMPRHWFELAPDKSAFDVVTEKGLRLKDTPLVADFGDFNVNPTDLMRTTESVIAGMAEVVKRGAFAVVLGGDHYVAYPSFEGFAKGIAERKDGARLGYIHIDSHSDFYDEYGSGSRYNHGTCARRISENPMVSYKNMAWVGLNKWLQSDQVRLRRKHGLKMTTERDIREHGIEEVMREAMAVAADGTDAVYVSVDIDVVAGAESPGTGLSEPLGITSRDFLQVMDMLRDYKELGALDLCEVSPQWDPGMLTVMLSTRGLISLLSPYLFDPVELVE